MEKAKTRTLCILFPVLLMVLAYGRLSAAGNADRESDKGTDPSVPMKIAEGYKNSYEFDKALDWYEKVIQDFPGSLAAGNAILSKLALTSAQTIWYTTLTTDFATLESVQRDEAREYMRDGSVYKKLNAKADEFAAKRKKHLLLSIKTAKRLREDFYRFEKHYSSLLQDLTAPCIEAYTGPEPPIYLMEEEDVEEILALNKAKYLEYESRHKLFLEGNLILFCVEYLGLERDAPMSNGELRFHCEHPINTKTKGINFYYWLGTILVNSGQHMAAYTAFTRVIDLAKDEPYSKLAYEAEQMTEEIKEDSLAIIGYYQIGLSSDEKEELLSCIEFYNPYLLRQDKHLQQLRKAE